MRFLPLALVLSSFTLFVSDGSVKFKPLSSGLYSNVAEQKQQIIHSKKEFVVLWNKLRTTETQMGQLPPDVDFSKSSVVACYMGDQSNGMRVDSVRNTGNVLTIYERRKEFESDCIDTKLLVTPFALIEIPGTKWTSASAEITVLNIECED